LRKRFEIQKKLKQKQKLEQGDKKEKKKVILGHYLNSAKVHGVFEGGN
jgi:hypothetical protein